jgi:hypothetical protein
MHDGNEMHNLREHTVSTNTKNIVLVHGRGLMDLHGAKKSLF